MKRLQSVLCASALAIALSPTVLAGNIHSANGNIHSIGVTTNGNIHSIGATAIGDITGLLTWGDITGVITAIFGNIHG